MVLLFQTLKNDKFLIVELLKQNFFTQYKQSKFSLFWIIFNPFFQILIWSILHFSGFLKVGELKVPYIIYLIAGIILWWYSYSLYESISSIYIRYTNIILENRLNIMILVIESIIRQSVFFLIHLLVLFAFCIYLKVDFYPVSLLYPLFLIPLILFSIALGLIFAVFRVLAIDIAMVFDKIMSMLFFITPIIYTPNFNNRYIKLIIKFNPYSYLITLPKNVLIYGDLPQIFMIVLIFAMSLLFLYFATFYFNRMRYKTIEKLLQ